MTVDMDFTQIMIIFLESDSVKINESFHDACASSEILMTSKYVGSRPSEWRVAQFYYPKTVSHKLYSMQHHIDDDVPIAESLPHCHLSM